MAAKSASAKYYASHPEARAKKAKTDKEINKRPEQVKKREANAKRREATAKGQNIKGKDYSHGDKKFVDSSKNRGYTSGTKGDINARGGGKRK
jgi:hypothetical protein